MRLAGGREEKKSRAEEEDRMEETKVMDEVVAIFHLMSRGKGARSRW